MKTHLTYEELDFHNKHPNVCFQWDGMGTGCAVCDQFCQAIQPQLKEVFREWTFAEAYEDAANIAKEVAESELEVSRGYKGHMAFQSQSYIDAAVEIEEQIRARAKEMGK